MIRQLVIRNFRGFKEFHLGELRRVNLFVGRNNCGKTTLLEAGQLVASNGNPNAVLEVLSRRSEWLINSGSARRGPGEHFDVKHLFFGHELVLDQEFSIRSENNRSASFTCRIIELDRDQPQPGLFEEDQLTTVGLEITGSEENRAVLPLTDEGGLKWARQRFPTRSDGIEPRFPSNSVPTAGLTTVEMQELWNRIALTDEEVQVIDALRIIDPTIERLAFLGPSNRFEPGIFLKIKDSDDRIPIGSLGDGIKRLLALILAITESPNGLVTIDEIDTGLHHTVLDEMWKLVIRTAMRLNVQVFATTHSHDCVRCFSELQEDLSGQVALMRIESGSSRSTSYAGDELRLAASEDMELRGWE